MANPTGPSKRRFRQLTADVTLSKFRSIINMNWHNVIHLNPAIMTKLVGTTKRVFSDVVLFDDTDEGIEVAIAAAEPEDESLLPLTFSKSHRTATMSLTLVVSKYPMLRVPRGRLRSFPVSEREEGGRTLLVLNLKESTVELAPVKKRKNAQGARPAQAPAGVTGGQGAQASAAVPSADGAAMHPGSGAASEGTVETREAGPGSGIETI